MDITHIGSILSITICFITDQMKRLIKFKGAKTPAFISRIKGKKVCDVTRHKFLNHVPLDMAKMPFVQWRGSTEDEFFVATFYGGLMTLDINEREMLLGNEETVTIVALASKVQTLNAASTSDEEFAHKVQMNAEYLAKGYMDDVENLKFSELMKIIGWKFASRKVKEEDFCIEC